MAKLPHEGLQVELGGWCVCQRAATPIPRDRAVDQSPVFFGEAVIAEPELLHDACGVPFYEDVCPSGEAAHNFLACLLLQVHTYALFIAVEPDEQGRLAMSERAYFSQPVPVGRFYFGDCCSQVADQRGAGRTRNSLGDV